MDRGSVVLPIVLMLHTFGAIYLIYRLWFKQETLAKKLFWSFVIVFPVVGPVLYLAFYQVPHVLPIHRQNRRRSGLHGVGDTDNFQPKIIIDYFTGDNEVKVKPVVAISDEMRTVLKAMVAFYRSLDDENKALFEKRAMLFLSTTNIVGIDVEVDDKDRILVAASAIIPVWAFKNWHYINIEHVILLPRAFNGQFEYDQEDSYVTGRVGNGMHYGKMFLSKPHLHSGFSNNLDRNNVGVHEFVHLIDMMDGDTDGFPELLMQNSFVIPWFDLMEKEIRDISKSNINPYAATDKAEFLAVTSEYFFERPRMLKRRHPELYEMLQYFYKQNVAEIKFDMNTRKKDPCPCGSGKKYKRCCMPA